MILVAGFVGLILLGPPLGIVTLLAGAVIEVGELFLWMRFLRRYRVQTGAEGLVGRRGVVTVPCVPGAEAGRVRAHGEIWRARCAEGAEAAETGAEIEVVRVDGLTLEVAPTGRRG